MARAKDFNEQEVLNKALCLFWSKGYHATSVQELVDHLGISRSSLYDTYGDKHKLYLKALLEYQQTCDSRICSVREKCTTSREMIRNMLEVFTADLLNDTEHRGCFAVNAQVEVANQDREVCDIVRKHERQIEDTFYQAIKSGQESGELSRKQEPRAFARYLVNVINGMRVSAKVTDNRKYFEDIVQISMDILE